MENNLTGKTIALLIANGFEESQYTEIQRSLLKTGAQVCTITPQGRLVNSWHGTGWGHHFPADKQLSEVLAADFDFLIIPGGMHSISKLSENPHTTRILRGFVDGGKKIAVLGNAARLFILAERANGFTFAVNEEARKALVESGIGISDEIIHVSEQVISSAIMAEDKATETELIKNFTAEMIDFFTDRRALTTAA